MRIAISKHDTAQAATAAFDALVAAGVPAVSILIYFVQGQYWVCRD